MQVIKVILIVLVLLASMVGVILGSGYIVANNPFSGEHTHDLILEEATDPTCTTPGYRKHYSCSGCGEVFADITGFAKLDPATITIAPYGHNVKATSCTESKFCETCNQVVAEAPGHTAVVDAAVAPTCTTDGKTEGSHCSVCGQVIIPQTNVSSKGHLYDNSTDYECNNCAYVRDASECPHLPDTLTSTVTPPTCTEVGYTTYICTCDYLFVADEVPATGHTEVNDAAVEPGCLTVGLSAGKHCSVCNVVTVAPTTIAAKGVHTWDGLSCTLCHATRFEAECADIEYVMPAGETRVVSTGREGKTPAETNFPSGDAFVYYMSYSDTTTLTFYVTASEAGKATVSVRMGCATYSAMLDNLFYVEVNGVKYENRPNVVFPSYHTVKYYDWLELEISDIQLNEGANIVKVIKPNPPAEEKDPYNSRYGLNFDYVAICPEDYSMILQDTRDANGHVNSIVDIGTYPSYQAGGELRVYCENCRLYEVVSLPRISSENYTKVSGDALTSVWQYTHGDQIFKFTVEEITQKYTFKVDGDSNPFSEAYGGSVIKNDETVELKLEEGHTFYGNDTTTATYTMKIYVTEDTTVKFIIGGAKSNSSSFAPNKIATNLKVNGSGDGVTYSTTSYKWGTATGAWFNFKDVEIATINLQAGENTITFGVNISLNIQYVAFEASNIVEIKKIAAN